jgi:hypothetical protein
MPNVICCLILYLASFPCFINMNTINSHLIISSFLVIGIEIQTANRFLNSLLMQNPLANRSDINTVALGRLEAKFVDILARELNFT